MNIKPPPEGESIEYDDAHSNCEDYPAIAVLINALTTRQFDAAILFAPPVKSKVPKAHKTSPADYWDEEDDDLPNMKELQRRLSREFTNYLGNNKFVRRFLNGFETMNYAFANDIHEYAEGSREYVLGELIAEEFDIRAGIDLTKLINLSFEFVCRHIMKVLVAIDVANKSKPRKSTKTKKPVNGKAAAEAKSKLSKAEHAKANAKLDGNGSTFPCEDLY